MFNNKKFFGVIVAVGLLMFSIFFDMRKMAGINLSPTTLVWIAGLVILSPLFNEGEEWIKDSFEWAIGGGTIASLTGDFTPLNLLSSGLGSIVNAVANLQRNINGGLGVVPLVGMVLFLLFLLLEGPIAGFVSSRRGSP